jgi:hypothetical protein
MNVAETLERTKRMKEELDALNVELAALHEPMIHDINDIPLIIGFLERRVNK